VRLSTILIAEAVDTPLAYIRVYVEARERVLRAYIEHIRIRVFSFFLYIRVIVRTCKIHTRAYICVYICVCRTILGMAFTPEVERDGQGIE